MSLIQRVGGRRATETFSGVMYQGRTSPSTDFDVAFLSPGGNQQDGPGFYLTSARHDARAYMGPRAGGTLLEVEVAGARLVPHTRHGAQERALARKLLKAAPHLRDVLWDWGEEPAAALKAMAASLEEYNETTWDLLQSVWYDGYHRAGDDVAFVEGMVALGYDAGISPGDWGGSVHLIVYNPDVLKAKAIDR